MIINNLGGTSHLELSIVCKEAINLCGKFGVDLSRLPSFLIFVSAFMQLRVLMARIIGIFLFTTPPPNHHPHNVGFFWYVDLIQ